MRRVTTGLFTDPGPTRSAFALLDAYDDGSILVREAWYDVHNPMRIANALLQVGHAAPAGYFPLAAMAQEKWFGIETIKIIFRGKNAGNFLETKKVEGLIEHVAKDRGVAPILMAATHWRKWLLDNHAASDAEIRCVIEYLYRRKDGGGLDLPAMTSTEREHCYDAIGGGIIMLAERLQYPCPLLLEKLALQLRDAMRLPGGLLPPPLRRELAEVRLREKAARQEREFRKATGLPPAPRKRRHPTRATQRDAVEKGKLTKLENKLARGGG